MSFHSLLCFLGILCILPALALTSLAMVTPLTASGSIYLLGWWLVTIGLILAPWWPTYHLGLILSGVIVIVAVAGVRLSLSRAETSNLKVIVLPWTQATRGVNLLLDEQDSVLFGEGILHLLGGVTPREHDQIVPALSTAYLKARATEGVFPSPFVSTYLGWQKPDAFDAVVIEPDGEQPTSIGVVFLHGFMGNVTIQCWQIAQAGAKSGAVTVCPSTGWIGDWWKPEGEAIIRATLRYLRGRGVQRLYLGGYSNGGNGIGRLSSTLATEPGLRGFFFIAGMNNPIEIRDTQLPVLVIQGSDDERMLVEIARRFVAEIGPRATYLELKADHFLIMKQPQLVQEAMSSWLASRELDK